MASLLLVEADPGVGLYTQVVFRDAGHQVTMAREAKEAFGLMAIHHFDLVIVGDALPGRSGVELLQTVEDFAVSPGTRLILHTADPLAGPELGVRDLPVEVLVRLARPDELLAITRLAPGLELA